MLLLAKAKLTTQGKVKLTINDEKEWDIQAGSSLLESLSNLEIFLPSACGGKGTCGMCKCRVTKGGRRILPIEAVFFNRKECQNYWRLACQVKVQEDIKTDLPKDVLGIKRWKCEVVSNRNVASFIKECIIKLPKDESLNFRAGAYVQVYVPEVYINYAEMIIDEPFCYEWDQMQMWDLKMSNNEETYRVYSMANPPAEKDIIVLNVRIATPPISKTKYFKRVNPGICSSYIFSLKPGDKLMVSGPYGDFYVKGIAKELIFIGGGAGMAPLRSQVFDLLRTKNSNAKISFWYGARSKKEIYYEEALRSLENDFDNFRFTVALSDPKAEDKWSGFTGFISDVVYEQYLQNHEEPEEVEYYVCGPPKMSDAVRQMLYDLGVDDDNIALDEFS